MPFLVDLDSHKPCGYTAAMSSDAGAVFLRYSSARLETLASWIDECLSRLTLNQIWHRSEAQNAVGTLVVHLCGNVHERITLALSCSGPSARNRETEFDLTLRHTPEE